MMNVSRRIWIFCLSALLLAAVSAAEATTFSIKPTVLNPACVGGPNAGDVCAHDMFCGECTAGKVGDPCDENADCDSSPGSGNGVCNAATCEGTEIAFTCAPGTPNAGNSCDESADCDSSPGAMDGCCGPSCTNTIRHVLTCNGGPHEGEPCTDHSECESGPNAKDFFCIGDYEIRLLPDDVVITEITVADWSPNDPEDEVASVWQVAVDTRGFLSNECQDEGVFPLRWDRPIDPIGCILNSDCPPEYPICGNLQICVGPNHRPELGFVVDSDHPDYIFRNLTELLAVDYREWRAGSRDMNPGTEPAYTPPPKYLATMAFMASDGVCGDIMIPFKLETDTYVLNPFFQKLEPAVEQRLVAHTVTPPPVVIATDPANCTIDPGQTREVDVSTPQGWDRFVFQFREDDDLAGITALNFELTRVPNTSPPFPPTFQVSNVDNVAKTVTVDIIRQGTQRPIDTERWTCLE
ncbi:MAG: hypothetical protein PVI86_04160 [Phycisphaerae bacterium]|jgi:hypothetical protein